ncbi:hypothetical protein AVEN_176578-1 [Araneus ventricosus]|uniref:Uncharacterized protein n=1 Tax=Araneus ventricosus TaxID=182803 RepID=A0A4Y2TNG3_ARAVE|nr:hypothetical protein AVEN_176578-1 [Araneus ventricosus]
MILQAYSRKQSANEEVPVGILEDVKEFDERGGRICSNPEQEQAVQLPRTCLILRLNMPVGQDNRITPLWHQQNMPIPAGQNMPWAGNRIAWGSEYHEIDASHPGLRICLCP